MEFHSLPGLHRHPSLVIAFIVLAASIAPRGWIVQWDDHGDRYKRPSGGRGYRVNAVSPGSTLFPGGFWDKAEVVEPEGTQQITLRLPRRVLGHFKSTGKGYQSRISAVRSSSVDAMGKRKAG